MRGVFRLIGDVLWVAEKVVQAYDWTRRKLRKKR